MHGPSFSAADHSPVIPALEDPIAQSYPLYECLIQAGFPSPADDYVQTRLDLNEFLAPHPSATFFVRVSGDSMIDAGILDRDYLIVDRSVDPRHNLIVVAAVNGDLLVKRLFRSGLRIELRSENHENQAYQPINITHETELLIWGVVRGVFRKTL